MADQPKYTRLRNIILGTTLCFAILPTLLVGVFIPIQFTELYREKSLREVENVARSKGRTIDIFFEERVGQLKTLAHTHKYEDFASSERLYELLRIMKSTSRSYVDLGVIDMQGRHVAYAGSYDVQNANYKNEVWFNETLRKGIHISDVFFGFRQFPHIIIAVLQNDGGRSWILRATIDSDVFNSTVQASRLSNSGDAFVVNRSGILQTDSRQSGKVTERVEIAWPQQGTHTAIDNFLGQKRLLAKVPLAEVPWLLVVSEEPDEYMNLLMGAHTLTIVGVLLALTAILCCTWFTTRLIIRRLVQADQEKAAYDASLLQSSKMAALGKMAAGVAHEINNPLMLIRESAGWISDMLEDEDPKAMQNYAEIRKAAGKIESHVTRASTITHRLLGFARRVDPSGESLLLDPIIVQALGFLQSEATHRGITLERAFNDGDARVYTDVGQLQQVILNLVDNAIDALGKRGTIRVSTERLGDTALIHVCDDGPGIPAEKLAQIFDPFFTTKNPGEGTGLGLSICYSIMQNLNGNIRARNLPEGGACFTLEMPIDTEN